MPQPQPARELARKPVSALTAGDVLFDTRDTVISVACSVRTRGIMFIVTSRSETPEIWPANAIARVAA